MSPDSRASIRTRLAGPPDQSAIEHLLQRYRAELGLEAPAAASGPRVPIQIIVAELDGELVGLLAVQRCQHLARGSDFLLLTDIFAVPEHRQKGIARALMRHVREHCRAEGCREMRLIVSDFNTAALTTAARSGFTRHDELMLSYSEE